MTSEMRITQDQIEGEPVEGAHWAPPEAFLDMPQQVLETRRQRPGVVALLRGLIRHQRA